MRELRPAFVGFHYLGDLRNWPTVSFSTAPSSLSAKQDIASASQGDREKTYASAHVCMFRVLCLVDFPHANRTECDVVGCLHSTTGFSRLPQRTSQVGVLSAGSAGNWFSDEVLSLFSTLISSLRLQTFPRYTSMSMITTNETSSQSVGASPLHAPVKIEGSEQPSVASTALPNVAEPLAAANSTINASSTTLTGFPIFNVSRVKLEPTNPTPRTQLPSMTNDSRMNHPADVTVVPRSSVALTTSNTTGANTGLASAGRGLKLTFAVPSSLPPPSTPLPSSGGHPSHERQHAAEAIHISPATENSAPQSADSRDVIDPRTREVIEALSSGPPARSLRPRKKVNYAHLQRPQQYRRPGLPAAAPTVPSRATLTGARAALTAGHTVAAPLPPIGPQIQFPISGSVEPTLAKLGQSHPIPALAAPDPRRLSPASCTLIRVQVAHLAGILQRRRDVWLAGSRKRFQRQQALNQHSVLIRNTLFAYRPTARNSLSEYFEGEALNAEEAIFDFENEPLFNVSELKGSSGGAVAGPALVKAMRKFMAESNEAFLREERRLWVERQRDMMELNTAIREGHLGTIDEALKDDTVIEID